MPLFGSSNDITTLGLELRGSALDNPATPLGSPATFDALFGGSPTESGEQITEANAMQVTTVYSCVTLLASSASTLPLKLMEKTDKGHVEAIDNSLHYLLADQPNPDMTAVTFIETMVGCLASGNCYAQIERNSSGQPVALWPLHPHKTEPIRTADNLLAYKTSDGMTGGAYRIIKAADVIHVPLFSLDGLKGISPIMAARQALGLAKATEKFGAKFFGNGTRPGGIVFNKGPRPDPKTQKEMRESWQEQSGGNNQGKTQFLWGGDWSYEQLGISPEESQFLATRNYQRADIASLWKISPHLVGDTSRLSGTNTEQLMLSFLILTLRPYLVKLEAEFNRKLCPTQGRKANRYFFQFDVSALLRTDLKSQNEAYVAGRNGGWYTANDVLRKLGENPAGPEADILLVPVNYQAATRLLEPVAADPAVPTAAERSALGTMTDAYIGLFRDSFGRVITRNKRDFDAISTCFRPVLTSICEETERQAGIKFDLNDGWDVMQERTIKDVLKSLEKRAGDWTADKANELAGQEFTKAVRAIVLHTYREAGAAIATKEAA